MENRSSGWELLGGLAIGAIGGFMAGYYVAKAPAQQEGSEALGDAIIDVRERTNELIENMRGNTEALLSSTRAAIEEKMSLLNEAVEAGKRAAEYKRAELIEQDDM